nr:immunoglobulin heavy chain junction region [Macaca mulatta]MOX61395.1 immunoglobulin heavy chain junction region [Macaca mulatta]MOX62962.1 immunoglobulin heavy chain junction region [Macaca mulatta]MOX66635.1 immunoglobulin heavy chain junction region [Macaca mulatta]MOX67557.1 immunoglobulin heavy chain junction region [Macaca mulatta]
CTRRPWNADYFDYW